MVHEVQEVILPKLRLHIVHFLSFIERQFVLQQSVVLFIKQCQTSHLWGHKHRVATRDGEAFL